MFKFTIKSAKEETAPSKPAIPMEYEIIKHLWIGLAGYWLQQLTDDRLDGVKIPSIREQVVGLGPGVLYQVAQKFYVESMLYFETNVRNRSRGISFITRILLNF